MGTAAIITVALGAICILASSAAIGAKTGTEKEGIEHVHILFDTMSAGVYNKNIDDHLKFITAAVSLEIKSLCNKGEDISWDTLQAILAQCTILEADPNKTYGEETFGGEAFSKVEASTWFYDFIKKHDSDVLDAARMHAAEIDDVIQFISNKATDKNMFAKAVSDFANLIDIGMIRFPTEHDPCVKLYRLQLKGTVDGKGFMFGTYDQHKTLTAVVNSRKYYSRSELLQRVRPDIISKTIEHFEKTLTE